MIVESNDSDSDSRDSDSTSTQGEDVDIYLNHYRIPKLINYGLDGAKQHQRGRENRERVKYSNEGKILSLTELAAQKVACHLPFGQVEHFDPPVPEPMQCRIAYWSFPQDEEDIKLYTCLANGSPEVLNRAEDLISLNCVCDMLQVGFHLSANVESLQDTDGLDRHRVAITFDRRRITSCSCSCLASTFWCQHSVAVCFQRIRKPQEVILRAPVSESLQRLEKDQLQKFAQYLINELPQQILPAAQKLLDELLSGNEATINRNPAAPDPTAGATIFEQTRWCLDDTHLSADIQKIIEKHCTSQDTVCDVQALNSSAPPAATEYSQLLRPIRGREPEGLWNLILIVGEMMKRRDANFLVLLEILTNEVLKCDKVVNWWFETKVSLHLGSTIHQANTKNNSKWTPQYSCSNFCDEIVHLWRLAAIDPSSSAEERQQMYKRFFHWHLDIITRQSSIKYSGNVKTKKNILELFPGFKPAMEGCFIDWSDWDDRNAQFVIPPEKIEIMEEQKLSKAGRRRKKKSKALKKKDSNPPVPDENQDPNQAGSNDIAVKQELPPQDENDDLNHEENRPQDYVREVQEHLPQNRGECHQLDENQNLRLPFQELDVNLDNQDIQNDPPIEDNIVDQADVALPDVEPELRVYFMDKPLENPPKLEKSDSLKDYIKVNTKKFKDPIEILYAKVEGLHAHGYQEQARKLASLTAEGIIDYPNLKLLCIPTIKRKKKKSVDNQMSILASETLSKIVFLCNVISEDPANYNLIFRLVMFGLGIRRSPTATKPLEIRLINQKQELVRLLKPIPLHESELEILRRKAASLRDGPGEEEPDPLLTLILGSYVFEALVLSKPPPSQPPNLRPTHESTRTNSASLYGQPNQYQVEEHFLQPPDLNQGSATHGCDQLRQQCSIIAHGKIPSDLSLGFQAALETISVKVNLVEVDHPLLCEGIRRQRGELALALLSHYKDDQEKLDLILKYFLDNDVILSMQKTPSAKKNSSSQDPYQPTKASAHFIYELSKTVFDKAGGNSMTAHIFRPQLSAQNGGRGIHRRLHMCALRIALYSLGLQNRTSPHWMQRTYNGRASFVIDQALDIGLPAMKHLLDNWDGFLTPVELASIADKAGCSNDSEMKRVAASMAQSCLKYANYLDFNAVRRILNQCREQSIEMLEEACMEIEKVAERESVCADVLFITAKTWGDLYVRMTQDESYCLGKEPSPFPDQESSTSGWLMQSYQSQESAYQHMNDSIAHHVYGMVNYVPTTYIPTYKHIEYIKAAHRVGLKALNSLKPSLQVGNKHNPKKEEDIFWLLGLSKGLGRDSLNEFCQNVIKNVTNFEVFQMISCDLIGFFKNLPQDHVDRAKILNPFIELTLNKFVKHLRERMKNLPYDQASFLDQILDVSQLMTGAADTWTAATHFKSLLRLIDSKKSRKLRIVDTNSRHEWVDSLLSKLKHCSCTKCQASSMGPVYFNSPGEL